MLRLLYEKGKYVPRIMEHQKQLLRHSSLEMQKKERNNIIPIFDGSLFRMLAII